MAKICNNISFPYRDIRNRDEYNNLHNSTKKKIRTVIKESLEYVTKKLNIDFVKIPEQKNIRVFTTENRFGHSLRFLQNMENGYGFIPFEKMFNYVYKKFDKKLNKVAELLVDVENDRYEYVTILGYTYKNGNYGILGIDKNGLIKYFSNEPHRFVHDNSIVDVNILLNKDDAEKLEPMQIDTDIKKHFLEYYNKKPYYDYKNKKFNSNDFSETIDISNKIFRTKADNVYILASEIGSNDTNIFLKLWIFDKKTDKLIDTQQGKIRRNYYSIGSEELIQGVSIHGEKVYLSDQLHIFNKTEPTDEIPPLFNNPKAKKIYKNRKTNVRDYDRIESHSFLETANKLHALSIGKTDNKHAKTLFDIVSEFETKNIIPDINTYIKKKKDNFVGGFYNYYNKKDLPIGIYLTDSNMPVSNNNMGLLEAYVHELVHTITRYGIDLNTNESSKIVEEIKDIRQQFVKKYDYTIFLNNKKNPSERDINKAKAMYKYITEGDRGLHEFVALGLTNKNMIEALSNIKNSENSDKNIFEKLLDIFAKTYKYVKNLLVGSDEKNASDLYEKLFNLSIELGRIQQRANENIVIEKRFKPLKKFDEFIDNINKAISKKVKEKLLSNDFDDELYDKLTKSGGLKKALYLLPGFLKLINSGEYGKNMFFSMLNSFGLGYGGITQTFIREIIRNDEYEDVIEKLGLLSANIDRVREEIEINMSKMFKKELGDITEEEEIKMYNLFVQSDAQSLLNKYSIDDIIKITYDKNFREKEIKKIKEKILKSVGKNKYNFIVNQAKGLAYYMQTNKANEAQYMNAKAIAKHISENNIEEDIDILTTLFYFEFGSSDIDEEFVHNINTKYKEPIEIMLKHLQYFYNNESKNLFENDTYNRIKGYNIQKMKSDIDIKIGLSKDEMKYRDEGYVKVADLKNKIYGDTVSIYINKWAYGLQYKKQAMRITDTDSRGTTIEDIVNIHTDEITKEMVIDNLKYINIYGMSDEQLYRKLVGSIAYSEKKNINKLRKSILKSYYSDENIFDASKVNDSFVPTFDKNGEVKTFRLTMSKELKDSLFEPDYRISNVIGRMYGRIYDLQATSEHNEKVVKAVLEDGRKNYKLGYSIGKNGAEYEIIKPMHSKDEKGYWELLPYNIKKIFEKEANERFKKIVKEELKDIEPYDKRYKIMYQRLYDKYYGVPIRKDMIRFIFGERKFSITDTGVIKILPLAIKNGIRLIENIWHDIVGIAKENIIIKIPQVAISNIVSNIILTKQLNIPLSESIALHRQGIQALKKYRDNVKRINELKLKINAKKVEPGMTLSQMKAELKMLENDNEKSIANELIKRGGYLSLVEELVEGEEVETSNKLVQKYRKIVKKMPISVKKILDYTTLNSSTIYYKMVSRAIQESDFATKFAIFQYMADKKRREAEKRLGKKVEPKMMQKIYDDVFLIANSMVVNYNKIDNKYIEYLNDMGFILFTKYLFRIQKTIKYLFSEKPASTMSIELLQRLLGIEVDDVIDSMLINKNLSNYFHGPIDIIDSAIYGVWELPKNISKIPNAIIK